MRDFSSTLSNHLEFTIHGLDERDSSPSPSHEFTNEEITTELFLQGEEDMVNQVSGRYSSDDPEQSQEQLTISLEDGLLQESSLLQNLRAIKEEAWAKRKARKLRRAMKKVQFQDNPVSSVSFCRSCARRDDNMLSSKSQTKKDTDRESTSSGESGDGPNAFRSTTRLRPMAHVHSINMFDNIIPRHVLENGRHPSFTPFGKSLTKMLADIG